MEFVVLPDHPAGAEIAARLTFQDEPELVCHSSGRPWIVGVWRAGEMVSGSAGENQVVLLGCTTIAGDELARRIAGLRSVHELNTLAGELPGSFHLIASIGGEVRVQGTLSTACQVFSGTIAGEDLTVAADRPQTIAALAGSGVEEETLPLYLLSPWQPWPLNESNLWRGVTTPPFGHYLRIERDGTAHAVGWWRPPEPELPFSEGVTRVREALRSAVAARRPRDGMVSADLSGGLDSTSLCFLADHCGLPLVTIRNQPVDPSNDDDKWGRHSEERMPGVRHVVVERGTGTEWFEESTAHDLEGPTLFARVLALVEDLGRLAGGLGSVTHLQGINGDELFHTTQSPMYLHALVRQRLRGSVRHIRALKAMRRWSWPETVRFLAGYLPYSRWLESCADQVTVRRDGQRPEFEWDIPPELPPWATAQTVATTRALLRAAAAEGLDPLAPLPIQHRILRITQANGAALRQYTRVTARAGVSLQAPYLDDRVLEAVLSIRISDRMAVGRFKPVLTEAMRGIAPDSLLERKTKGDYSAELYSGLRRRKHRLLELCEGSRLAQLGLIDPDRLRAQLRAVHPDTRPLASFEPTLGCERWLRSLRTTVSA
jgi:asparagine synthase (glutamine-hydrolysing)